MLALEANSFIYQTGE